MISSSSDVITWTSKFCGGLGSETHREKNVCITNYVKREPVLKYTGTPDRNKKTKKDLPDVHSLFPLKLLSLSLSLSLSLPPPPPPLNTCRHENAASSKHQTYWYTGLWWGIRWSEHHSWCKHPECIVCLALDWEISPLHYYPLSFCNTQQQQKNSDKRYDTNRHNVLRCWTDMLGTDTNDQNNYWLLTYVASLCSQADSRHSKIRFKSIKKISQYFMSVNIEVILDKNKKKTKNNNV